MKLSNHKKNRRLALAGVVIPTTWRSSEVKPFDVDKFILDVRVAAKEHPEQFHNPEEMSLWNPPSVVCACGFRGKITDCGRTYFPPDNIGWDCPECNGRVEVK